MQNNLYQNAVDALNALTFEDIRKLSTVVENRLEQMDNHFCKQKFAKDPFKDMVNHSNFKTRFSLNKIEGLSVEYDDLDIEYEITNENVTISVVLQGFGEGMINSWDLTGTPDNYEMYDSCYDNNPKTQQQIPADILNYAVFLWKEFNVLI